MLKKQYNSTLVFSGDDESIKNAAIFLQTKLRKGDIILSGAIPRNFYTRFINIVVQIICRLCRGISHSCIYLGNNIILDIDHKIIRHGAYIETVSIETFIKSRVDRFGGISIYAVRPRKYNSKIRKSVVDVRIKSFLEKNLKLKHSYLESLKIAYMHFFEKSKFHKENLNLDNKKNWTCSHMVAYILKKGGTNIGKKASNTFVSSTFLFSKYFTVKKKLIIKY